MYRFNFYGVLVLLAIAISLLVTGCRAEATPTRLPTPTPLPAQTIPGINERDAECSSEVVILVRNTFSANLPISTEVALVCFQPGEEIEIVLIGSDRTQTPVGSATANRNGQASLEIRHDGLPPDTFSVLARTERGARAGTLLVVK